MIPVSLVAKCVGVMKHDPADRKETDPQLYCVSLKFEKTPETPSATQINLITAFGVEFKLDAEYAVDISFLNVPAATTIRLAPPVSVGRKSK